MNVETILAGKGRDVLTIAPDAVIADAVKLLETHGVGAAVVTADGKTVNGILSERDIIRGLGEAGPELLERRIASIMVRKVHTVAPSESADRMLGRMTEGRFRHLPVMENGRLTGVVSIGDVVKLRLDDLIGEAEAMRDYIAG